VLEHARGSSAASAYRELAAIVDGRHERRSDR
jgi:hypothetical protein